MLHECINCGNTIPKKTYESVNRYKSRKFCSQLCSRAYMRINQIGWFKQGALSINKKKDNEIYSS